LTSIPTAASGLSALEVARALAREAGALALARFRTPQHVTTKSRGNLVTETDFEIEAFLQEAVLREFPGHRVLSEETAAGTDDAGWVWVIDPLDGTKNFVAGIPFFCINIALCHDGEPFVAVTHDPTHNETFWAERGRGAWANEAPAAASTVPSVQDAVLGVDIGYDDRRGAAALQLVSALYPGLQSVRVPGSAALGLAYAACGRYSLFLHHDLQPWDLAPGILLLREAGGVVSERDGRHATLRSRVVVAGGRAVHADFLRWLHDHRHQLDPLP
jgi:fructose-1,6-bisphosphatase/inositol monophosphatase family enzyme